MWQEIISELIASGLSEREIASRAGLSQPQINRLKLGRRKSVKHETGERLRKLHKQVNGVAALKPKIEAVEVAALVDAAVTERLGIE